MVSLKSIYRSHTCAELRKSNVGETVTLSGWVMRKRDHGGLVFIDLRDNYGVTQVVLSGELTPQMEGVRAESVICITGKVVARDAKLSNSKLETGEIEVAGESLKVLSHAEVLPLQVAEEDNSPEATRLRYRFLELRRERLHRNIILRSKVVQKMRELMVGMGFTEFQTPILTSSSPEGARDFIVPSRHFPGKFFALPQAPQQFKQLLMVSGFDRYFQVAPCFRDEDPRADRSPAEFYQLDIEMSFVEQDDVFAVGEKLMVGLFSTLSDKKVTAAPFPRIRYEDSIRDFGSDKPDLRIPLRIKEVTDVFKNSTFRVFQGEIAKNGQIRAIAVNVDAIPSRKAFDEIVEFFSNIAGQGVAYLSYDGAEVKGSIAKFVTEEENAALKAAVGVGSKTVVFLAAGSDAKTTTALSRLRVKLGEDFNQINRDEYAFCWIVDYPMYERDELTGEIGFSHNPFSMPQGGLEALNSKNPLDVYAYQYDIVCNGYELSSGAIRNHEPEIMYKAFKIAGYDASVVDDKFGGMINAFKFGAPPHGGFAPGVDRIVMLLANEETIREVIAFPFAQTVEDLMMAAPSTVSDKQLRECHLQVIMPPKAS